MKFMFLYDFMFAVGAAVQFVNLMVIFKSRRIIREAVGREVWTGLVLLSTFTLMRQVTAAIDLGNHVNNLPHHRVFPFVMSLLLTVVTIMLILKLPKNKD